MVLATSTDREAVISGTRLAQNAVAGTVLAGAACVAYGALVERTRFVLRQADVPVLGPGSGPIQLLHLSDLHLLAGDTAKRAFLADLAGLDVDLLVVTGDMLGEPAGLAPALEALGAFRPGIGAVAVLGSNDYYAPRPMNYFRYFLPRRPPTGLSAENPYRELVGGLDRAGWRVLTNARAWLADVELAGLDDPHLQRDDLRVPVAPDGQRARVRIGVVHSPESRVLDAFERHGYRLILAGHTHGGQVRLPGIGALVTNCDLPREHARGLFRYRRSFVHVSAGMGTSKFAPFRFDCRPEATVLSLLPGT